MTTWTGRILATVAVWLGALGFVVLTQRHAPPMALACAVTAGMAVGWLILDTQGFAVITPWMLYHTRIRTRTFDPRFSRLSQELSDGSDRTAAANAVHASLCAVADEILRDTYDVNRSTAAEDAERILGRPLSRYLRDGPTPTALSDPDLLAALDRLESL